MRTPSGLLPHQQGLVDPQVTMVMVIHCLDDLVPPSYVSWFINHYKSSNYIDKSTKKQKKWSYK